MQDCEELLELCQRHFPGLAWDDCNGCVDGIYTAALPAFYREQKLIVADAGDGNFEVSVSTKLDLWVTERIAIGPDAIAQAAEQWQACVERAVAAAGWGMAVADRMIDDEGASFRLMQASGAWRLGLP